MGLLEIVSLIKGVFTFLDEVKWLVGTLQATPEEKRQEVMGKVKAELDVFAKTDRPKWD